MQTDGSQVNATFLYGEEMTVTPNCVDLDTFGDQCGSDFITTITEPGFSVTVESADSEPSEPEPVTEESLEAVQDELEASEEEPVTIWLVGNSVNGDQIPSALDRWNRLSVTLEEGEDNGKTRTIFSGNGDINPPAPISEEVDLHHMGAKLRAHWLGLLGFGAVI